MTRHFPNQNGGTEFHQQAPIHHKYNQNQPHGYQFTEFSQKTSFQVQTSKTQGPSDAPNWISYQNDVKLFNEEAPDQEDNTKRNTTQDGYNLKHHSSGDSGASGNEASMENHQGSSNSKVEISGSNSGGTITNTFYNTSTTKAEKKDDRKAASNKQESSDNSGSLESKAERNSD